MQTNWGHISFLLGNLLQVVSESSELNLWEDKTPQSLRHFKKQKKKKSNKTTAFQSSNSQHQLESMPDQIQNREMFPAKPRTERTFLHGLQHQNYLSPALALASCPCKNLLRGKDTGDNWRRGQPDYIYSQTRRQRAPLHHSTVYRSVTRAAWPHGPTQMLLWGELALSVEADPFGPLATPATNWIKRGLLPSCGLRKAQEHASPLPLPAPQSENLSLPPRNRSANTYSNKLKPIKNRSWLLNSTRFNVLCPPPLELVLLDLNNIFIKFEHTVSSNTKQLLLYTLTSNSLAVCILIIHILYHQGCLISKRTRMNDGKVWFLK